ncbi:YciI family protein [Chitinophaga sp. HK235]|uniref:YciI family protein n=1 Tax=Chitinophaga sp. HK235 TaxID=2952571 RepID=UPI001BA6C480|nr:YciI family protein [Chitinophaga sp. HK235]
MKEFLFIIRGEDEPGIESPAEMEQHLEHWQQWLGELIQTGHFVAGQQLASEGKTVLSTTTITDRPLAEGKELIAGYLIIRASDAIAAAELAKACPSLRYGCTIEVREIRHLEK